MATEQFSRAHPETMIEHRHPLLVLATRSTWSETASSSAPVSPRRADEGGLIDSADLFIAVAARGPAESGDRVSAAQRASPSTLLIDNRNSESIDVFFGIQLMSGIRLNISELTVKALKNYFTKAVPVSRRKNTLMSAPMTAALILFNAN